MRKDMGLLQQPQAEAAPVMRIVSLVEHPPGHGGVRQSQLCLSEGPLDTFLTCVESWTLCPNTMKSEQVLVPFYR